MHVSSLCVPPSRWCRRWRTHHADQPASQQAWRPARDPPRCHCAMRGGPGWGRQRHCVCGMRRGLRISRQGHPQAPTHAHVPGTGLVQFELCEVGDGDPDRAPPICQTRPTTCHRNIRPTAKSHMCMCSDPVELDLCRSARCHWLCHRRAGACGTPLPVSGPPLSDHDPTVSPMSDVVGILPHTFGQP